jgi:hypothetical protein
MEIMMIEEQKLKQLQDYLKIFDVSLIEFSIISFDDINKIILITKSNRSMVKFVINDSKIWKLLKEGLPEILSFAGFQHAEEGNVFSAFALIGV